MNDAGAAGLAGIDAEPARDDRCALPDLAAMLGGIAIAALAIAALIVGMASD